MARPVKLREIIETMEIGFDEMSAYLNQETSEIVTVMEEEFRAAEDGGDDFIGAYGLEEEGVELAGEILDDVDEKKFVMLPSRDDIHEWSIMKNFCHSIDDEQTSRSLLNAIRGKGAFRYFKDSLDRFGIVDQWHKYKYEALKQIAVQWCESKGIEYIGA